MKEIITSNQNPKIKNILQLIEKSSERRKQGTIVVEGLREIGLALQMNFKFDSIFYVAELEKLNAIFEDLDPYKKFQVSKNVFDKIAFRENSDGVVALLKPVFPDLEQIALSKNPLVIVLESVEKPGNLGAILRTADAASADAVIVCDPKTDIYNPNTIRSSVGCVFTTQVVTTTNEQAANWLRKLKITAYAAALTAESYYHQVDFRSPVALVMGTEAKGLSPFWLDQYQQIKIPMLGKIDSLNVSNSTAILVFEALRQRNFNAADK